VLSRQRFQARRLDLTAGHHHALIFVRAGAGHQKRHHMVDVALDIDTSFALERLSLSEICPSAKVGDVWVDKQRGRGR